MPNRLQAAIQALCNAIRALPRTDEPLEQMVARGIDRGKYDATLPIRQELTTVLEFLEPFEGDGGAELFAELPRLHATTIISEINALGRIVADIPVKCQLQTQTTGVVPPSFHGSERGVACQVENAYSHLYSELAALRRLAIDALTRPASGVPTCPPAGLTGWPRVDRCGDAARRRLETATIEEEFQTVGLLCRETLISLAEAVYDPAEHVPTDGVTPSRTDAYRMLSAYFTAELSGGSNEATRAHAKASLKLANDLQHRRTASFRDAALCVEATRSAVNIVAIISGRG
jgi:hypothetical protein